MRAARGLKHSERISFRPVDRRRVVEGVSGRSRLSPWRFFPSSSFDPVVR